MRQQSLFFGNPDRLFRDRQKFKDFILSGNAKITVESLRTKKHFTYKIRKDKDSEVWFVSRLGSNGQYHYLGTIFPDKRFKATRKTASIFKYSDAFVGFDWLWNKLGTELPASILAYHEGRCGMCGRDLTDPDSIREGYGPDCLAKRKAAS